MACGLAAALLSLNSCSSPSAPKTMAAALEDAEYNQVYSFNDQLLPSARQFSACGALPERAQRALIQWLEESELRDFSYARPQYYVELTRTTRRGRTVTSCWALCTDGRGNLTGVMAPKGKDPRVLPTVGNYKLYVCNTENKAALNEAIMSSLEPCDAFRVSYRTAKGLRTISKPRPAAGAERLAAVEKAKAAAAASSDADSSSEEDSSDNAGSEDDLSSESEEDTDF